MNYRAYLRSDHWLELRAAKLEDVGFRCERCRCKSQLEVHHLHYNSMGHERLTDLRVLCRWCHQKHHDDQIPVVAPTVREKKCPMEIKRDFRAAKHIEVARLESEFFAAAKMGLKKKAEQLYQQLNRAKAARP